MPIYMYHEMHKITYREAKSMTIGVFILQVWTWDHFPMMRPIYFDGREDNVPYIYKYCRQMT